MKNSPCKMCLVKPICMYYCDNWFHWLYTESVFPLDVDIEINKFLVGAGNYGPIKNFYQNEYTIEAIKFQETDIKNRLRVCLTVMEPHL